MKLIGKKGLSGLVEIALLVLMGVAVVLMALLPVLIPLVTDRVAGDSWYTKYLVVLLVGGVMAELILWQARGIMKNVNRGCVFSADTVRRLRIIAIECLVLAVLAFAGLFVVTKFFMALVMVAFAIIGAILFVFAELFRQAIEYKNENDMTI